MITSSSRSLGTLSRSSLKKNFFKGLECSSARGHEFKSHHQEKQNSHQYPSETQAQLLAGGWGLTWCTLSLMGKDGAEVMFSGADSPPGICSLALASQLVHSSKLLHFMKKLGSQGSCLKWPAGLGTPGQQPHPPEQEGQHLISPPAGACLWAPSPGSCEAWHRQQPRPAGDPVPA